MLTAPLTCTPSGAQKGHMNKNRLINQWFDCFCYFSNKLMASEKLIYIS